MFCENCGKEIPRDTKFCPFCGTTQQVSGDVVVSRSSVQPQRSSNASPKSRTIAALLAFFLGAIGVHRFYVGKVGTGILQILLTCCFGLGEIWALIDLIIILCGNFKDKQGLLLTNLEAKY